jgi:hypothetical protein
MGLVVDIYLNQEFKKWQVIIDGDVGVNLSGFYTSKDRAIFAIKILFKGIKAEFVDVYVSDDGKRELLKC